MSRTRMRRGERQQAVLGEAIKAISEKGYHGFSLTELAKRCGLTNAGLLHHFGSKEGLLVALLQERDRLDNDAITGVLRHHPSTGPQTLDACLEVFRAIMLRNVNQPEIIRLYAILRAEALAAAHPAFDYFRTREMGIIDHFRVMVADLVPDPTDTARQIIAMMNGLETQWLRESRAFDLPEVWDRAARKILRPVT